MIHLVFSFSLFIAIIIIGFLLPVLVLHCPLALHRHLLPSLPAPHLMKNSQEEGNERRNINKQGLKERNEMKIIDKLAG